MNKFAKRRIAGLVTLGMLVGAIAVSSAPAAFGAAPNCPDGYQTKVDPPTDVSASWGSATVGTGYVEFTVNSGYELDVCVKGGANGVTLATITGPDTQKVYTPLNPNDQPAGVSHYEYTVRQTTTTTTPTTSSSTTSSSTTSSSTTSSSTTSSSTYVVRRLPRLRARLWHRQRLRLRARLWHRQRLRLRARLWHRQRLRLRARLWHRRRPQRRHPYHRPPCRIPRIHCPSPGWSPAIWPSFRCWLWR